MRINFDSMLLCASYPSRDATDGGEQCEFELVIKIFHFVRICIYFD